MENKPNNNEISELLARLQKQVEQKPEPVADSVKPTGEKSSGEKSAEELLDLLKKNIGAKAGKPAFDNQEYSIEGFEFEEEFETDEESKDSDEEQVITSESSKENTVDPDVTKEYTAEEQEILHSRVEMLVSESVAASEDWELPQMAERSSAEEQASIEEVSATEELSYEELPNESETALIQQPLETDMTTMSDNVEETEEAVESEVSAINVAEQDEGELVLFDEPEEIAEDDEPEIEEETIDEYADNYLSEHAVKRFFRFRRLKVETEENKHETVDTPNFDDVDINLALALGSKEELENSVGYARVRAARNGFYDPFLEEFTGDRTYGYCGEEFRNDGQTDSIKKKYAKEQSSIKKRFVATLVLSILILFFEHLPMTPLYIPYLSDFLAIPICYYLLAVVFSMALIAIPFKKIWSGIRSCFFLQGEPFVPVACLALVNFVYNLVILIFFVDRAMPVYNFAVAIFLLLGIVDDAMRLTRERLAFDVVSDRKPKLSLEKLEGRVQNETASAFSFKQDFFVEKVNFVGNFFTRFGRRSVQFSEYFHEFAFSALGALAVSLLSLYVTKDISSALTAFVFSMLICVPMQFLTVSIYPFFHLTKGLSRLESAVIGDAVTEEYHDADTIYLEDAEMFGKHGARVVGIRVYNDMDFYSILSYALSIFSVIGAPLCNVFDNAAQEIEKKENVKITNISVGGVEAVVDLKTVYIGNLAFMRSHGYFPKRNPDDEQKIESGQINIVYMAIGGDLCAKIYMQYTVTQRFEKFAAEMLRNGVRVGIRTLDPNVNEKMIATLRNDKDVSIKVIRPTPNELIPIGKHSDSGIVTAKNSHMVFKILEQCFNIKRIHKKQRQLRLIALMLGVAISLLLMAWRIYVYVPSLYIVIYHLVWLLTSLIYTKSKLK